LEFSFDRVADALYLRFSHEKVISSDEIAEGIIVDYGKDEHIIGIEILNFSKREINLNEIIQLSADELIPVIVQC
jgi:uncharacterized protein YuzE